MSAIRPFSIRFRKGSGTWVIYDGPHIFESGFGSEEDAIRYFANYDGGKHLARAPKSAVAAMPYGFKAAWAEDLRAAGFLP